LVGGTSYFTKRAMSSKTGQGVGLLKKSGARGEIRGSDKRKIPAHEIKKGLVESRPED